MNPHFEVEYELRYFEMSRSGEASPAIMLALLEEAAAEHCLSINYGLYDLMQKDIGWVLVAGAMQMERYPRYKEKIRIRTWLSEYSTVRGFRENLIFDAAGQIIGRAKGLWMFFDVRRRRPVPIFPEIISKWSFDSRQSINHNFQSKIEAAAPDGFARDYQVRPSEIDMYQHVNNVRYLQWLLDSIPEDISCNHSLAFIEGRFISEIKFGDHIRMITQHNGEAGAFTHTIRMKESGKICATAVSRWEKRL